MDMLRNLKRTLAAGAVVACFSSPAHAIVAVADVTTDFGALAPSSSRLVEGSAFGSFIHDFLFSLTGTSSVSAVVTRVNLAPLSQISDFTMTLQGASQTFNGADLGGSLAITNTLVAGVLSPGSYTLRITGTGTGSGVTLPGASGPVNGIYSGALTVTPAVPEPEIWAMMAIGAGLVGFQLRRKQRNAASVNIA